MKFRTLPGLIVFTALAVILSSCNLGATPPASVTQDVGAIQTEAFNQIMTQAALQQTQTAAAAPLPTNTLAPSPTSNVPPTFAPVGGGAVATNTPFVFNTQQPGFTPLASPIPTATLGAVATITTKNGCNDGRYVGETKPLDGTVVKAGSQIKKGWQIENIGTCDWDGGYVFKYREDLSTPGLGGYDIVIYNYRPDDFTLVNHSQTFIVKLTAPTTPGTYKGYWKLRDDAGNYFGPLVSIWIVVQ
jgi:hypothetical protein